MIQLYPILLVHSRCSFGLVMSRKLCQQLASQAQSNFYLFTYANLKCFYQKMSELQSKVSILSG